MKLGFLWPQATAIAHNDSVLDLVSELIDAHADTVELITAGQQTELAWSAHCDYLRALQRHGHETLAHDDQHTPASPLALPAVSALNTAITMGWTAGRRLMRSPARAAQALGVRSEERSPASTV